MASRANHLILLGCGLLCAAALLCTRMVGPSVAQAPAYQAPPAYQTPLYQGPAAIPNPGAVSNFPIASDARLAGDARQTRFILDLDKPVQFRAFALADPYRVIVDLPQVSFQLPAGVGVAGRGVVKAFRYGLVMPGGSRIVFDLMGPAKIAQSYVLEAANGQPPRRIAPPLSSRWRPKAVPNCGLRSPRPTPPSRGRTRQPRRSLHPGRRTKGRWS